MTFSYLLHFTKNNISKHLYEPQNAIGSGVFQCLQLGCSQKKVYLFAFRVWNLRLESEFPPEENTSTG